ncbi:MAG: 16S rRNA (cytosine(1402)-N(4))-methyltransferase RsmH [Anaerovoracaceae bacterium]
MEFKHKPVLLDECIENLKIKENGVYVDGTVGGAGHSSEICKRLSSKGTLIAIDRDDEAIEASKNALSEYKCKKIFVQRNYADIKEIILELGIKQIDGVLLDLGVSSFQLDSDLRGFTYMRTAALDMRMNCQDLLTAKEVINTYSQKDLTAIIRNYGEENWASRISQFIVNERKQKEIETTTELVEIVKKAIPAAARRDGPHPAKRTFQAIRIEVNDELGKLKEAISAYCNVIRKEGRVCVISFHSLEDRIVKDVFNEKANPCTCPNGIPICVCGKEPQIKKITKKPIIPRSEEIEENPRSRSAKLRVAEGI